MPSRDELVAIANQKASEQAIQQIANDYKANTELYYESAAAGKYDDAAYYLREARRLEVEAAPYVAATQQQAQQPQQQFTQAEQEWINRNANVVRDPKKWNECLAAANSLVMRGYDRNSAEYLAAIELAIGLTGPDGKESNEIISPNQVVEICKITPDQYREGAAKLAELKRQGFYKVE